MHTLICGFVLAVMALFPGSAGEGGLNLRAWMESYEKCLFEQMEENFKREQETSEEIQTEAPDTGSDHVDAPDQSIDGGNERVAESVEEYSSPGLPETGTPVAAEAEMAEGNGQTPLYQVDGYIPDEAIQTYLYQRLCDHGIGYFMPYAVCLIAQESTWNPMAENRNGLDKGLLQYRISYWPTLEWWNPYAEIEVFVAQMANRAKNGKTVSEMISAHNQSDYGPYCQSYVDAVMQHSNTLVQIR